MRVDFFNFAKKSNSTKVPTGAALASFDCILKDGCSVISPVIMLEAGLTSRPAFNYCYIPDFQRYYFISDWTFNRRLWAGSLTVDVLASYKSQIGQKSMYVLRSSISSNGRIVDNKYPMMTQANSYIDDIGGVYEEYTPAGSSTPSDVLRSNYFSRTLAQGYYYLGVVGANSTGVTWYVMSPGSFNTLVAQLYQYDPSDMPSIDAGIRKQLADPMQYIVSCYWLPTDVLGLTFGTQNISFGNYAVTVQTCAILDPVKDIHRYHASFSIRKHPQASARGVFLNQDPYSHYRIVFAPFGSFDLDSSLMIDDATATASWYIDYTTGIADLTIKVTNSYMVHTQASMGVPIRLNQATIDMLGVGGGILGNIGGMFGAAMMGNIGGVIGGMTGAIGSAVSGIQPKVQSKGGGGSFIPYNTFLPKIYSDFYMIADEYNAEMGRPLCVVTTPATLGGGYIIAEKGDLEDTMALEDEIDMINSYISGGFFYE